VVETPQKLRDGLDEASAKLLDKNKENALAAWTALKKRSSGGGAAVETAELPIFKKILPPVGT